MRISLGTVYTFGLGVFLAGRSVVRLRDGMMSGSLQDSRCITRILLQQAKNVSDIAVNGFRNIEVVPTAVGPEAGTATLFVDEARRGLSSMEKLEGTTPLQVPVATLLSVVNAPASIASMR